MSLQAAKYVAIRDDHGVKSLSNIERNFIRQAALSHSTASLRTDGREMNQVRPQQLHLSRWDNGASVTVLWGKKTRVTCLCTAELIPPHPDRPSEGMVAISVQLSPSASTSFRQAPPSATGGFVTDMKRGFPQDEAQKLTGNRILRCLERVLLTGGALDTEALCVTPGSWVWRLQLSVTVLDAGGNLLDASVLAAVASLRHYRKPHAQLQSESSSAPPSLIPADLKEPTPLPLHHTPVSISFALILEEDSSRNTLSNTRLAALIDPTDREELVSSASLTIALNVHGEICLLDYGGGSELPATKLRECWAIAEARSRELCQNLERMLAEADEMAMKERLERLQRRQHGIAPDELPKESQDVPYFQVSDAADDFMHVDQSSNDTDLVQQLVDFGEEEYRKQALDYNVGHVASKVKSDDERKDRKREESALLAAMLKSVTARVDDAMPSMQAPETSDDAGSRMDIHTREREAVSMTEPVANSESVIRADTDDEEEVTMQLESEFSNVVKEGTQKHVGTDVPAAKAGSHIGPRSEIPVSEQSNDVDDLAAAIKTKKKKKKASK